MPLLNFKIIIKSFQYAFKGLKYALWQEQNFQIQIIIASAVIILMIYVRVKIWEAIILLLVIIFVLVLELLNSIFEKMIDILKPRVHHYVKIMKDMMAAAVFLASLGALIVGLLIFLPYFFPQ